MAMNDQIKNLKYEILFPAICDSLQELYTLSGKFQDVEKIKIFSSALTKELPNQYPFLTIPGLRECFNKAIMGYYGEIKTIALPDIYKWLRLYEEQSSTNSVFYLASPDSQVTDQIDWSRECYKAYQKYRSSGLGIGDFCHLLYDRMQLDNFIPLEDYRRFIPYCAGLVHKEEDNFDQVQRELAKKCSVLGVFERLKKQGTEVIYKAHQ